MKLRLPHKFQAALMAALASVSITTLSSTTAQAAMQDAVWDFEGSIEAQTGITGLGYEFKGGTATYVDSNIFIGRDLTSTQVSLANLGQAIDISSSQYIRVTDNGYWSTGDGALKLGSSATNDFTISVWTKLDAISGERFIMGTSDGDNMGFSFAMEGGGKLDFLAKSVAHHDVSNTTAPMNQWVNLTITYDAATGASTGYINGDSIGTITLKNVGFKNGGGNLGIGTGSANKKQASFDGQIASLSILSGAMTAEQVKAQAAVAASTLGTYTWSATAEGSDWADAVWTKDSEDGQYFQNIGNAVFGADAAVTTVGVRSTTHAHDVTLGGTYTFNLADGVELTMNKLTLENAASAAFNSTGSAAMQIGTVAGPGTITAGQGVDIRAYNINAGSGTVTIAGAGSVTTTEGASGNVAVSSGATWKLGGSGNWTYSGVLSGAGNIEKIGAGTLTLGGNNSFTGPVLVKEGTLKLNNGNALGAANNSITIEEGATVDVNGKDNRIYYYTLHGGSLVNNGGNTDFNHTQNARITLTADSTVGGSGKLWMIAGSWGDTTANLNNHTLTKEGTGTFSFVNTDISAGTIMVNQGTVEFYNRGGNNNSNVQANIVLNGGTISGAYNYTASETAVSRALTANQDVTVTAAIVLGANVTLATNVATGKTLTMSGAITGAGTIDKQGDGNLVLNGATTIAGTIANQGGSLALNGAVTLNTNNIGAFEVFDSTGQTYSYETKGSGYLTSSGQYYLAKGTEGATASHGTSITGGSYVDSTSKTKGVGDIIVTFDITPGGTYYVNQDMSTHEDVAEGGSYNILSATDVSIKKNVTLTAASSSDSFTPGAKLHGEGTYALASGSKVLNGNLSLGNDWAGSVALSGGITDVGLNYSTAGTGLATSTSSIELKGVTGWIQKSHNANIIMTNPDASTSALQLTNGSSGTTGITYFTGSISGSGDFEHAWNKDNVYFELQGDLSQWTGNIIKSKGGSTHFTLSNNPGGTIAVGAKGNSGTLNINVTNNAPVTLTGNFAKGSGTLNVNVKDTTQATFTGSITNANLTVNTGASATMATDATITGITNNGTVAVTGGHTVKLITSANANLGSVVLSSGDSTTPSTIGMRGDGAARTYTFDKLAVSGQGHVSVVSSNTGGQGYHAQVNITSLTNADDSPATIYLGNSAHANASIYNINGGSFTGEIVLRGESDGGTRLTGYQFNDANVAANSVLTFDKAALGGINKLGLGLGADITVQGIRHAAGMTESTTIYSGAYTFGQNSDFVSYGTDVHTITIAGAGEYATSATVKNHVNLAMDGAGTQTFSGNMSAFNGTITVNDGTLALDSAVANAGAVAVNGGSLVLGNSLTTTSAMTVANGATLKFAGTDKLTVGGNLTLGGYLDVSNIACEIGTTVNLASYSGTLDYSGATLTGLAAGVQATLGASDGHLTLTFAEPPMPEFGNDLGKVMYVGDSITDGVESQHSWRYSFFKILADEGIGQAEEGYFQHHQTSGAIPEGTIATYGGRDFQNTHSAQSSARSYEVSGTEGPSKVRFDRSYIKNWLGQDETKTNGDPYPTDKPVYRGADAPNTYFMLLGTNDLLSEGGANNHVTEDSYNTVLSRMFGYNDSRFDGETGTFDVIWKSMTDARENSKLIVMEMPTWNPSRSGNHDNASDFAYMAKFNQKLHDWAASKESSNITVVNPNPGIVDVANTTKPGAGVANMFISDGLHPSAQGELLIAGNIAKQLGYAGRSVGLDRANSSTEDTVWHTETASITVTSEAQTFAQGQFNTANGYTVDFGAAYGNGIADGWSASSNALSVQVGDGYHTGILTFSEAYVMWGNTILYSRDNSQAGDFRIAYVNQSVNASDNVTAGYYVWMGDQLIGEALTAASGDFNGIKLTSTGANGTVTNLTWSDTAYAPTTKLYENEIYGERFHLVQIDPSFHDNAQHSSLDIDFAGATSVSDQQFATGGQPAEGKLLAEHTDFGDSWFGPAGHNHTGNIEVEYSGVTSSLNMFGVINAAVTGDVSTVIGGGSTFGKGEYSSSGQCSIIGAFRNGNVATSISGKLSIEINDATMTGHILMGTAAGTASFGATDLRINSGAVVNGNIFGGHHQSTGTTTGDSDITITGGTVNGTVYGGNMGAGTIGGDVNIRITGGIITGDVNGGGTGGTITGSTNVTVEGYQPFIGGNINAQNVTLKNVAPNGQDYEHGFDYYAGTINATNKLTLDNYTVGEMLATVNATRLDAINGTVTTINNMGPGAVAITVDETSSLTLGDVKLSTAIVNDGNLTLAGNVSLDMMTATHSDESYVDGKVEGNGFYSSKSSVSVFETDHMGIVDASGAHMTYMGGEGTYNATTGVFTTSEAVKDLTTFYINAGSENLTTVTGKSADATVTMDNTTRLVVDEDMSTSRIIVKEGATGTLDIQAGKTVTSDGKAKHVTLTGSGVYALQDNTWNLLDTLVTEGEDHWKGIVRVSNVTSGGSVSDKISLLATTPEGRVELKNVTAGYLGNATNNDAIITAGIILTGSANDGTGTGFAITDGYSGHSQTFTGSVSGHGDLVEKLNPGGNGNQDYVFQGDISGWDGSFKFETSKGAKTVTYSGNAWQVASGISQTSTNNHTLDVHYAAEHEGGMRVTGNVERAANVTRALNLHVDEDATFTGEVKNASSFTVAEDKTATLQGEGKYRQLGNVTMEDNASLNIMNIAEAAKLSVGDVTIGAGATMGVYTDGTPAEANVGTLTITDGHNLTAGGAGAKLNANLVMDEGSTLDVSAYGGTGGLNMGCSVTLNPGMSLSTKDMESVAGLGFMEAYDLYHDVESFFIGTQQYEAITFASETWVKASEIFNNDALLGKDYYVFYSGVYAGGNGGNVGTIYIVQVPEPTTGTLSLLALCALAARRRRKH